MITGVIKNKVDKIWTDLWVGGITNPLTVIEQLTYLMFIRSLDEKELENEEFENMTGQQMEKIFPQSPAGQAMRWSRFKDRDGSGHGALAGFLQAAKADALICGGIGMGAQIALADAGIKLYAGVQGSADAAAQSLASGKLEYDPDAHCDRHGQHHDGDCGHDHCADHHCHGN